MDDEKYNVTIKPLKRIEEIDVHLTPEEYFILSRIDGNVRANDLIALTGIEEEKLFSILEKFSKMKIIEDMGFSRDEVDLKEEEKKEIDNFLKSLEKKNFFEILQIKPTASSEEIRDAGLSILRKFHPDRFFRKKLGPYKAKLEKIVEKVNEAMEILLNEEARKIYAEQFPGQKPEEKEKAKFRKDEKLLPIKERVEKARTFYEEALKLEREKRYKEAILNLELAIAYDPFSKEYKEKLSSLKKLTESTKDWRQLYSSALSLISNGNVTKGLHELEECLLLNPAEAEPYLTAMSVLKESGKSESAIKVGEKATEKFPNHVEILLSLASLYEEEKKYLEALALYKKIIRILTGKKPS